MLTLTLEFILLLPMMAFHKSQRRSIESEVNGGWPWEEPLCSEEGGSGGWPGLRIIGSKITEYANGRVRISCCDSRFFIRTDNATHLPTLLQIKTGNSFSSTHWQLDSFLQTLQVSITFSLPSTKLHFKNLELNFSLGAGERCWREGLSTHTYTSVHTHIIVCILGWQGLAEI